MDNYISQVDWQGGTETVERRCGIIPKENVNEFIRLTLLREKADEAFLRKQADEAKFPLIEELIKAGSKPCMTVSEVQQKVSDAVQENAKCRYPGVADGLYTLPLEPFRRLGHGVPMIRNADPPAFSRANGNAEFEARLRRFAPFLVDLDFAGLGLRLAGGAASALFMRSKEDLDKDRTPFHDFDLFLVGHKSDAAALHAVDSLGEHLARHWGPDMMVHRTQGCISFYVPWFQGHIDAPCFRPLKQDKCPLHGMYCMAYDPDHPERPHEQARIDCLVQVVLRKYSTEAEVIHGFDLGSSAFLWDGKTIRMTALGKLAAEHGVNVFNMNARRGSLEHRIARYFTRGFDIILPDLNTCALLGANGRMPYLYAVDLEVGSKCNCILKAKRLCATRPDRGDHGEWLTTTKDKNEIVVSDYAFADIPYGRKRALTSRNLRTLQAMCDTGAKDKKPFSDNISRLCAYAQYTSGMDLTKLQPVLDGGIVGELACWAWGFDSKIVNIKTLHKLLGPDRAMMLMLEFMSTGVRPDDSQFKRHGIDVAATYNEIAHLPFAFMVVENKTALTGPFPRELVDYAAWYGDAMRFRV